MTQATYDIRQLRQKNLSLMLKTIWAHDGISRADLSRELGMSRSSVSSLVEQLLSLGVVGESHLAKSSGGRPPVVLQMQPNGCQIVGVDIGSSHILVLSMSLDGQIYQTTEMDFDCANDPEGTLQHLYQMIDRIQSKRPLLGIGVAVPSPVLNDTLSARILPKWSSVNLVAVLQQHYDVPVFVDNDANLGALAEKWWGSCQDVQDFVYIKMATGVGAGLVQNGQLLHGASGFAGEIGHVPVSQQGLCRCGMTGCLESLIGLPSVIQQCDGSKDLGSAIECLNETQRGQQLLGQTAKYLSGALAMLINVLNPTRIVIWGPIPQDVQTFLDVVRDQMLHRNLWTPLPVDAISLSRLGEQGVAQGAATLILEAAFVNPLLFERISR